MKKAILTISCAAFFAISAKIKAQQLPLTFLQNWQKSYGGTSNDGGSANFIIDNDFIYLPDGGMIICATSNSNNYPNNKTDNSRGLSDYWVIRTDASGNKLWDKTYGGSGTDRVSHIMRTSDGGFLLTGSSTSPVSGEKSQASFGLDDVWLVKIDENGVKLWDKTFGGSSIDGAIASEEYSSGDIIVGATSRSPVSGNKTAALRGSSGYVDSWVIKINSSGDKIWDKSYGGTLDDDTHTIKTTADGGFLLGSISKSGINGTKTSPNLGNWDYWVVKANSAGNQEWDKTYGGTGMDVLSEISAGYDGGYVLAGYSESDVYPAGGHLSGNRGGTDFWLVKIDVSGNHVWDHIYGGTEDDICMGLDKIKSADEGYLMVGWSNSDSYDSGTRYKKRQDNYGPSDCWMVRTNNCGVQWWDFQVGGSGDDGARVAHKKSGSEEIVLLSWTTSSDVDKTSSTIGGYDLFLYSFTPNTSTLSMMSAVAVGPRPSDFCVTNTLPSANSNNRTFNPSGSESKVDLTTGQLWPNPVSVNSELKLQYSGSEKDVVNITIYNVLGELIYDKTFESQTSSETFSLEVPFRTSGYYSIKISNQRGENITKKFVVTD